MKCIIEISSGGNDNPKNLSSLRVSIHDAVENKLLIGCIPLGLDDTDTYCCNVNFDSTIGDKIPRSQFISLEKNYMTK